MAKFKNYSLTTKKKNFSELSLEDWNDSTASKIGTVSATAGAAIAGGAAGYYGTRAARAAVVGAQKGIHDYRVPRNAYRQVSEAFGSEGHGNPNDLDDLLIIRPKSTGRAGGISRAATINNENLQATEELLKDTLLAMSDSNSTTRSQAIEKFNNINDSLNDFATSLSQRTNNNTPQFLSRINDSLHDIQTNALRRLSPREATELVERSIQLAENGSPEVLNQILDIMFNGGVSPNNSLPRILQPRGTTRVHENIAVVVHEHADEIAKYIDPGLDPRVEALVNWKGGASAISTNEISAYKNRPNRSRAGDAYASGKYEAKQKFRQPGLKWHAIGGAVGLGLAAGAGLIAYNLMSTTLEEKFNKLVSDSYSSWKAAFFSQSGDFGKAVWKKIKSQAEKIVRTGYNLTAAQDVDDRGNPNWKEITTKGYISKIEFEPKYIALWMIYILDEDTINCGFKFFVPTVVNMQHFDEEGEVEERKLQAWDCVKTQVALTLTPEGKQYFNQAKIWDMPIPKIDPKWYSELTPYNVSVTPIMNQLSDNFEDKKLKEYVVPYFTESEKSLEEVKNPILKFGYNINDCKLAAQTIQNELDQDPDYRGKVLKEQVVTFRSRK